jgi:hypothetical protein
MISILVWVLVVSTPDTSRVPVFSLPMADLPSCERLLDATKLNRLTAARCVQVHMAAAK